MNQQNIIHIAAAIITNQNNEILLVRKQNSNFFMQAGGKIEHNETPVQALIRELHEELQLVIMPDDLYYRGEFIESAANEVNHQVKAHLFSVTITKTAFVAHAELAEVGWYSLKQAKMQYLAPLTKNIILPMIEKINPAN